MADHAPALFTMPLSKVTSFVLLTQRSEVAFTGTAEQRREHYRRTRQHNLLFNRWGFPFGVIWTSMALHRNKKTLADVERLAQQAAAGPPSASPV